MPIRLSRAAFGAAAIVLAATALSITPPKTVRAASLNSVAPNYLTALHWREVGPARGGRADAVAGVAGDPYTFYFGAVAGGVWKTTDAGQSWLPITDGTPISSVGAIAVAPSNPDVIYVGTGENTLRGNMTWGNGLYKSNDAGKTWHSIGLKDSRQVGAIIVDPHDPNTVLVAAIGHAFGPNEERGVFRSTDGGEHWTRVLYKNDQSGAIDVTFDPNNSKIVWASLWQVRRQPWNFSSGGEGSGLYRSTDGGVTWSEVTGHPGNGLPGGVLGRIDVQVSGANSNRVYAMVEAKEGGLYRSDDAGQHWIRINDDGRLSQRAWYFSKIYADPKNADTVYAVNTGLFRSTDGGKSFTLLPGRHGDHHALWIDPKDPSRFINANDGGAEITTDGGKTFSTLDNQPTAQFYHVAVDNRFPYWIYGAQQDNTNLAIASYSDDGSITDHDWYQAGGGEAGFVIPDPRDPDIIYSSSENFLVRFNRHTQQSSVISVWPVDASGHAAADLKERFNWTMPFILSPYNPDTLYAGMDQLYKSTNDGQSWTAVSPDLTRNDKSKQGPSGGPITHDITSVEYYDTIFSIAESPKAKGMIWVGSDDGLVHLTRDDGKSWLNVTPKEMPEWSTISMIDPSHFNAETAYVAVDRHKLDDIHPYAYATHDGGRSWTNITANLPDGAVVHAVREDNVQPGLLYAATEKGVFVSFDDGGHWQTLNQNLPATPVHDLVVHDNDLVIATHGRSFWVLDDVTPLRQAAAASRANGFYVYTPEVALRLHYPEEVDMRPPAGHNPPSGALIDYYLPQNVTGPVTMEIVDGKGQVIRHLTSQQKDGDKQPPEWPDRVQPMETLPAEAGLNRFVWDLRWDDPTQIPGAFYAGDPPQGPIALPGKYMVRVSYDGKTQSVPFTLIRDPRDQGSPAGLEHKFALALAAYHDQDALHRAVNDLRARKAEIEAAMKGATAARQSQGQALLAEVSALEGEMMQVKIHGSEANLNFPGMLNEQLYSFAGLLDDADTAPTTQEVDYFNELHARLGRDLDAWKALAKGKVASYLGHSKG